MPTLDKELGAPQDRSIKLLRHCARVDTTGEPSEKIGKLLDSNIDWPLFLRLTHAHNVVPLVYNTLRKLHSGSIPLDVTRSLAFSYLQNASATKRLATELANIAISFGDRRIDVMPFKGPALALSAYQDLSLRQGGDLDILVRYQDVAAANEILLGAGYRIPDHLNAEDGRGFLQNEQFLESASSLRQYQYIRPDGMMVELHWELGPRHFPFALNNEALWHNAIPAKFLDAPIYTLPPVLMFLLLMNHGSKHYWLRLSWICDIAEFIKRNPNLDWTSVISTARTLHMTTMVKLAVRLAAQFLDTPIPEAAAELLAPSRRVDALLKLVDRVHHTILDRTSYHRLEHYFGMQVSDRVVDRMRYGLFILTTPTGEEWSRVRLPARYSAFYRCVRLMRLVSLWATGK